MLAVSVGGGGNVGKITLNVAVPDWQAGTEAGGVSRASETADGRNEPHEVRNLKNLIIQDVTVQSPGCQCRVSTCHTPSLDRWEVKWCGHNLVSTCRSLCPTREPGGLRMCRT
ncbi:hypothetical protein RRG08_053630 [Elysia crispata]|uniref:Uncharacterized protein n=1 Tax=Elysia crispata TaxID=231223 RepID=A0AAE0Y2D4_9GAST|nr:hypothetical protein RRG08_053630 [Elysia crispata]